MNALLQILTPAGNGVNSAAPRKVLFLVTDGLEDYYDYSGTRYLKAFEPAYCQNFKNIGYAVYVVYTPYYPLMNAYYLDNLVSIVEGTGTNSITYNLQACASEPSNYIAANDLPSLTAALQTFLKLAMAPPAHFTQ